MMHCNVAIHKALKEYVNCPFCYKQINHPTPKKDKCCCVSELINDNNVIVCQKYGTLDHYKPAPEFIDFYENRYRIKRKSVYHRKYHVMNVMNDIAQTNGI